MRKLSIIGLFFITIFYFSTTVHAESHNVYECLDNPDCYEEDSGQEDNMNIKEPEKDEQVNESNPSLIFEIIKVILALLLILGLIYLFLKFLKKRNGLFPQGQTIENLGGVSVGTNKTIQIIRIVDKIYVVGVADNIELIEEITDEHVKDELSTMDSQNTQGNKGQKMFKQLFKNTGKDSQDKNFKMLFSNELNKLKKGRETLLDKYKQKDDHDE